MTQKHECKICGITTDKTVSLALIEGRLAGLPECDCPVVEICKDCICAIKRVPFSDIRLATEEPPSIPCPGDDDFEG